VRTAIAPPRRRKQLNSKKRMSGDPEMPSAIAGTRGKSTRDLATAFNEKREKVRRIIETYLAFAHGGSIVRMAWHAWLKGKMLQRTFLPSGSKPESDFFLVVVFMWFCIV